MAEFDITAKITAALQEYSADVAEAVDAAAKECAKGLAKDVKAAAPTRTGAYKKSWTSAQTGTEGQGKVFTVYSKDRYQLTHLLEHGHKKKNGGMVKAIPHIAQANEKWQEEFERRCEEAVKG